MSLMRVEHNKKNPYLTINTTIATDRRLSWKAKGIWLYAFSRPNDWTFYFKDLLNNSVDSKVSLRNGLKELEKYGYLLRKQTKDEKGLFEKGEWTFFETPRKTEEIIQKKSTERRLSVNGEIPSPDNETPDKRPLLSNEYNLLVKEERESNNIKTKPAIVSNQKNAQVSETSFRLSLFLFEKMKKEDPKMKTPIFSKEAIHMEKLLLEGRDEKEIKEVIEWTFANDFWPQHVDSAEYFVEKYKKLRIATRLEKRNKNKKPPEEIEAEKQEETIQENKRWVKDNNLKATKFITFQDKFVHVQEGERGYTIEFSKKEFKDQLEKAYIKSI